MTTLRSFSRPVLIAGIIGAVFIAGNRFVTAKRETLNAGHNSGQTYAIAASDLTPLAKPNTTLPPLPSEKITIYAKGYTVIDSATKLPFASKNADAPVPIASTTKIMSVLVALDSLPLDKVITVSSKAATITGSEIQLMTGEKMTVKSLLYGLMMNSANDAGYALAEGSGSVDDFVAKMNTKAKTLGLQNTAYKDPVGLDDGGHSSPHDLALLFDYALSNPTFRTIVGTKETTIWSSDNRYKHELKNSNRLIQPDEPLYYAQAIGGKTGFTYDAGHCLIVAAEYPDGTRHVAVVLHTVADSNDASAIEARKLLTLAETAK